MIQAMNTGHSGSMSTDTEIYRRNAQEAGDYVFDGDTA